MVLELFSFWSFESIIPEMSWLKSIAGSVETGVAVEYLTKAVVNLSIWLYLAPLSFYLVFSSSLKNLAIYRDTFSLFVANPIFPTFIFIF